jgi:hypothetical protein
MALGSSEAATIRFVNSAQPRNFRGNGIYLRNRRGPFSSVKTTAGPNGREVKILPRWVEETILNFQRYNGQHKFTKIDAPSLVASLASSFEG